MARFRKLRSTLEGRRAAYSRLYDLSDEIWRMTRKELVEAYDRESGPPSLCFPEKYTREKLIVMLLKAMARKIVDAP